MATSKDKSKPKSDGKPAAPNRHDRVTADELLMRTSISPEELYLAGLIPVSRSSIYDACESGEIESFRIGRRWVIPTAPLKKKLGIAA